MENGGLQPMLLHLDDGEARPHHSSSRDRQKDWWRLNIPTLQQPASRISFALAGELMPHRLLSQSARLLAVMLTLGAAGVVPLRAQDSDAKAAPNRAEGEGPFD